MPISPVTVLSLNRVAASQIGIHVNLGPFTISEGTPTDHEATFKEFAETIAYKVRRVIADEHRRSAVI